VSITPVTGRRTQIYILQRIENDATAFRQIVTRKDEGKQQIAALKEEHRFTEFIRHLNASTPSLRMYCWHALEDVVTHLYRRGSMADEGGNCIVCMRAKPLQMSHVAS
jgi:ABC-type iron transport system FetAB ATPase subunit